MSIRALILCIALATLTGCGVFGGQGPDTAAVVERSAALAFNGAAVALEVLDAREAAYLDTLAHPTQADLTAARARVARLRRARDALAIVRAWLAGEREASAGPELRDAAAALRLVAEELKSRGVVIPDRVTEGLALAEAFAKVGAL